MKVSPAAAVKIRSVLQGASNKSPRVVLRKGGCAGNMLVLLLEPPATDDEMITCEGIEFAVVKDCLAFCDDIVVDADAPEAAAVAAHDLHIRYCLRG